MLLARHVLDHLGDGILPHFMPLKNLVLLLVLLHQVSDPEVVLLTLLDERIDVLRHLLGRCPSLGNMLLVVEEDPTNFPEVTLVFLDLLHQSIDQRGCTLREGVQALDIFTESSEGCFDCSVSLLHFLDVLSWSATLIVIS